MREIQNVHRFRIFVGLALCATSGIGCLPSESRPDDTDTGPDAGSGFDGGGVVDATDTVDSSDHSCSSCPSDPRGTWTCDGTVCNLRCDFGTVICNGACRACEHDGPVTAVGCSPDDLCVATACSSGFEPCADGCCAIDGCNSTGCTGRAHCDSSSGLCVVDEPPTDAGVASDASVASDGGVPADSEALTRVGCIGLPGEYYDASTGWCTNFGAGYDPLVRFGLLERNLASHSGNIWTSLTVSLGADYGSGVMLMHGDESRTVARWSANLVGRTSISASVETYGGEHLCDFADYSGGVITRRDCQYDERSDDCDWSTCVVTTH